MKFLIINGPNLNMLGIREPNHYGYENYEKLIMKIKSYCESFDVETIFFQSNHEGDLIDEIQKAYGKIDGIIINPGAYAHTSIALLDALKSVSLPAVEVHISKLDTREKFRQINYIRDACINSVIGLGTDGYLRAVDILLKYLYEKNQQEMK